MTMANAALLLAAGHGSRIRDVLPDKVLAPLGGKPVLAHSAAAFRQSGLVQHLVVVYRDSAQKPALNEALADSGWSSEDVIWVEGGRERQDSVLKGLRALPPETSLVFIHDAARPLLQPRTLEKLAAEAAATGAACLARRLTDTVKEATPASKTSTFTLRTSDRSRLWAMETPQVFQLSLILPAYEQIIEQGLLVTDDAAALELTAHPVALVENPHPNPKLTTASDLAYLEFLLARQ
jgi:2-C-methyl-D-erythritol 4-phosphate cytidylyltransferase